MMARCMRIVLLNGRSGQFQISAHEGNQVDLSFSVNTVVVWLKVLHSCCLGSRISLYTRRRMHGSLAWLYMRWAESIKCSHASIGFSLVFTHSLRSFEHQWINSLDSLENLLSGDRVRSPIANMSLHSLSIPRLSSQLLSEIVRYYTRTMEYRFLLNLANNAWQLICTGIDLLNDRADSK